MKDSKEDLVVDDPDLLALMLRDADAAPSLYRPTNYWVLHSREVLTEIEKIGLRNFRGRAHSAFERLTNSETIPSPVEVDLRKIRLLWNRYAMLVPLWGEVLDSASRLLSRSLPFSVPWELNVEEMGRLAYSYTASVAAGTKAKPLSDLDLSPCGHPQAVFNIEGKRYTLALLDYYLRYVYCCRFLDFADIDTIVELGSGAGMMAEVFKKLNPRTTILLFDIPPQSYICEQYLKAVFPGMVRSYRDCRVIEKLEGLKPGEIHIFGAWQFPLVGDFKHDLFVGCRTFAEMEPENVQNYLRYVNSSASWVYLLQLFSGKDVARRQGLPGVLRKTLFHHYEQVLSRFKLVDRSFPVTPQAKSWPPGEQTSENAMWQLSR